MREKRGENVKEYIYKKNVLGVNVLVDLIQADWIREHDLFQKFLSFWLFTTILYFF